MIIVRAPLRQDPELLLFLSSSPHLTSLLLSSTSSVAAILPMMARTNTPALRGVLRNLRARPLTFPQQRLFGASSRCLANDKDKQSQQPSFKSQLYESTQQRLKRERAEQERFAQYQQTQSPGSRYAALMFGKSKTLRRLFEVQKNPPRTAIGIELSRN